MHSVHTRRIFVSTLLFLAFALAAGPALAQAPIRAADPEANQALETLRSATGGRLLSHVARETGNYDFVLATGGAVLVSDDAKAAPESRALSFLAEHGRLFGIRAARAEGVRTLTSEEPDLVVRKVDRDDLGQVHVRLDQTYRGLPVFGAQIVVHMDERGILGVNGTFVPGVQVPVEPGISAEAAETTAGGDLAKRSSGPITIAATSLAIYRTGLLEGFVGENRLAYSVEAITSDTHEQIWVDATTGAVLNRIPLREDALFRIIYSPEFDPDDPDANVRRREGDPPTLVPPVDNLYDFAGQVYAFFSRGFGRDSFDGAGAIMRSVYLVNDICPNAYWDSSTTNYCPGFDTDDIVAHEWGHAYTEHTHNLIYAYQSGALNESYSDIFGETVDLNNGRDTLVGGTNNSAPHPSGVRWIIGEDLVGPAQNNLLTRDMWDPDRLQSPGKVTSPNYFCGTGDGGGVHTNSGVPNHAYAMLVDGATYNSQTIAALGFVKAINLYYRAMTTYQVPSTNFASHDQALKASCNDLIGATLLDFSTGTPSLQEITSSDCAELGKAMLAVEMSTPPEQCDFKPQLDPNTPPQCVRYDTIYADDFESGLDGWTLERRGPRDFSWVTAGNLPQGRAGSAAFAEDPTTGTCGEPGTAFSMASPAIVVPALATGEKLTVRFDHYVETEQEWDGGNLKISRNGGPFTLVPTSAYTFNAPHRTLLEAVDADGNPQNTNPKAGEIAFTGTDEGQAFGSWGTTTIDLTSLVATGDSVRIQLDFGFDGCVGITGWFVDDFSVSRCPAADLRAPLQNPIADDSTPDQSSGLDRDGAYTLSWTYPGPPAEPPCGFSIEEAPLLTVMPFSDDAEEPLVLGANSKWTGDPQWISGPHLDTSTLGYTVVYTDLSNASLTMKNPFVVPVGAGAELSFDSFEDIEDGFDFGYVEASTNGGSTFLRMATYTGAFSGRRTVNLSRFSGQSVLIRFRLSSDIIFSFPMFLGWSIDNIQIRTSDRFVPIGTAAGSATQFAVTGRGDGTYSYRIAALFDQCAGLPNVGPYSNVEQITVELGPQTVAPTASFSATPNPADENQNVTFDGSASVDNDIIGPSPAIVSYFWSFGDGTTATGAVTTHAYSAAGTYRVTLTVTDNDGETASTEVLIQVNAPPPPGAHEATGGGHITVGGKKANFGFDAESSVTGVTGSLSYQDKAGDVKVQSQSVSSLVVSGNRATIQGTCTVNKVSGFTFTVDVIDNGSGSSDSFRIRLSNGYDASGTLGGGNITVK